MVEPSVQQFVCLTRACRAIREFPSLITIGGKSKDYLPEGLDCMILVCTLTTWLLFY